MTSFGDYDVFFLKLNSSGAFSWAKQVGGTDQDVGYSMVMDPSGNLYSTGYFKGTADFDPGSGVYNMTPNGQNDAFILKLNSSGGFGWAKQLGGAANESGHSIQLDGSGNLCLGAFFYGTIDADPGTGTYLVTSEGMSDCLVLKLTNSGDLFWASQTGGPGWDYTLDLALDGLGNIINVGAFQQTVDMDPEGYGEYFLTNADTVNNKDMFVQKMNLTGGYNCPVPNGLSSANITTTTADLSWNAVSGYTGTYNIRYREIGEAWIVSGPVPVTGISLEGLLPATAYEFQVRTGCPSNYSYSVLFITLGGCQDVYEPNETMASAAPIAINTDIFALISPQYDVDHFSFSTSNAAKNVIVTLTDLPADYNVYLYKSNGTLLGSSVNTGLLDETIVYNTNRSGSYIVKVAGYAGAYDPANCYTLHVTTSSSSGKSGPADISGSEPGNISIYPNPVREILNIGFVASTGKPRKTDSYEHQRAGDTGKRIPGS